MIQNLKGAVNLLFGKYMFATNIISSGMLMGIGDLIQQQIEYCRNEKSVPIDYPRLGRMISIGLAEGPIHHIYYVTFLEKVLPGMDIKTVTKKIFLDQIVASPVFILTFFYGMGTMERKSVPEINHEIKMKALGVYLTDWMVWPPVQFLNFYYLSTKYRVLCINLTTTAFNVYLSYVKHKKTILDR